MATIGKTVTSLGRERIDKWAGLFKSIRDVPLESLERTIDENPEFVKFTMSGAPYHFLTLLHMAAGAGDVGKVRCLIQKGSNVNALTEDGCTPLHNAAMQGDYPEVIEALVQSGADPSALMEGGFSPLMWAYKYNRDRTILALRGLGAKTSYVVTAETTYAIRVEELLAIENKVFLVALRDLVPPRDGELRMLIECTEVVDLAGLGAGVTFHTDTIANAVAFARRANFTGTPFNPARSLNEALLGFTFLTGLMRLNGKLPKSCRGLEPVLLWCRAEDINERNQLMLYGLRAEPSPEPLPAEGSSRVLSRIRKWLS